MEAMNSLESLGQAWPGVWYIVGSILFGIIGYLSFRRGRKTEQSQLTWIGLALMLYPYAVSETWMLWTLGAAMAIWVWLKWNPPS
jgi:hypothetical protein